MVFEGCGSGDSSSSSQESATLVVGLLYLWWGAMLVAGLGLGSDSETLFVAATDVEVDETLFSSVASDLVEVTDLEVTDFSATEGAGVGVGVLLASFAGVVVLVSTVLLA